MLDKIYQISLGNSEIGKCGKIDALFATFMAQNIILLDTDAYK